MLNRRGSIRRPVALAALALTVLVLGGTGVAIFDRGSPQPTQAPRPIDTGNTFVSLLEVCLPGPPVDAQLLGCMHGHDVESVELFSLSSGRLLGSITTVPFAGAPAVDTPAQPATQVATDGASCRRGSSVSRAITIRWIWAVPSYSCRIFASRMNFSTL